LITLALIAACSDSNGPPVESESATGDSITSSSAELFSQADVETFADVLADYYEEGLILYPLNATYSGDHAITIVFLIF